MSREKLRQIFIEEANEIIENVRYVISKWNEYATNAGIPKSQITAIDATLQVNI